LGKASSRADENGGLIIIALALVQAVIQTAFPLVDVNFSSDSADYVQAAAYRGFAYPFFLDLFDGFADPLRAAVVGQIWVFSAAACLLSVTLARATGHSGAGLVLLGILIINPMTIYFNYSILSESLFQSATCVYLACLVQAIHGPKPWHFAALGMTVGAMIAIRPVGFALLPILIVVVLCASYINGRRPWAGLALAVLGVTFVLLADRAAYDLRHDEPRESVLGNVLFAKSAMFAAGPSPYAPDDPRTEVWIILEEEGPADAREAISRAPFGPVSFFLMHSYEASLMFLYEKDRLQSIADQIGIPKTELMAEIGSRRILANPTGFLRLPLQHYVALWQPFYHAVTANDITAYIAQNGPFPVDNALGYITRDVFDPPYARLIHSALAIGWLASILILAASILWLRRNWAGRQMLTLAGLGVLSLHALLFLSATLSIASVRYLAALWPIVAVVICASFLVVLKLYDRRKKHARRSLEI